MVKAIFSSPIGRKIATTAMLTTAVIGANASNLKTNNHINTLFYFRSYYHTSLKFVNPSRTSLNMKLPL